MHSRTLTDPTIEIRRDEQRRTLGAMLADLPLHEMHADRLALENAAEWADAYLRRFTRPEPLEDGPAFWSVRGMAVELLRKAGEALGRLDVREARRRPSAVAPERRRLSATAGALTNRHRRVY